MTTTLDERLDTTFAALANSTRRAILARLSHGEATVNELAEPFALTLPAVSKHLKVLEEAGLIQRARRAQFRPSSSTRRRSTSPPAGRRSARRPGTRASTGSSRTSPVHPRRSERPMTQDTQQAENVFRTTRTVDAQRDAVWRAWTDPGEFAAWYGPDGASIDVLEYDVQPGGRRVVVMHVETPDGPMTMTFAGEFREVDEPQQARLHRGARRRERNGDGASHRGRGRAARGRRQHQARPDAPRHPRRFARRGRLAHGTRTPRGTPRGLSAVRRSS